MFTTIFLGQAAKTISFARLFTEEASRKLVRISHMRNGGSNPAAILPTLSLCHNCWSANSPCSSSNLAAFWEILGESQGGLQDNVGGPANEMRAAQANTIVYYLSILQDSCWVHGTAGAVPVCGQQQHHFPGVAVLIWQRGRACNQVRTITHR